MSKVPSAQQQVKMYIQSRKLDQSNTIENFCFNNPKFFVGKLIKYNTTTKKFSIIPLPQKGYTVSVKAISDSENHIEPLDIDISKLSEFREIKQNISSQINKQKYEISANLYRFISIHDFITHCNILFFDDAYEFLSSFKASTFQFRTNAICVIKLQYYSIDADYIEELGCFNYLKDNVAINEIKDAIHEDEVPLYISSEKHGKILMLSIQTNINFDELQSRFITEPNLLNLNSFIKNLSEIEDVKIVPYTIGCNNKSIHQIKKIDEFDIMNDLFDAESSETEISYTLSNLSDNSEFGLPSNILSKEILPSSLNIKLLYVISDKNKESINFLFLETYRDEGKYIFDMTTIKQKDFCELLSKSEQYLSHFNILMLGGIDGKNSYSDFDKSKVQMIDDWRSRGGFVLFLHDFIVGSRAKAFKSITNDLNFQDETKSVSKFESVEISSEYKEFLKEPYPLTREININATHESAIYDSKYIIVHALNNPGRHYYCENLERGVGDMSIGHTPKLASEDERLFVDIIVRIMKLRFQQHEDDSTNSISLPKSSAKDPPTQSLNDNYDEENSELSNL